MNTSQFKKFSPYTDPGEHAFLLEGLPTSLEEISDVIHAQIIHPGRAPELVTQANKQDEETCRTVHTILAKLQERSPVGLSLSRKPEHRVVNNCCGHSQLMAAIMKTQGIPSRVRCGFSLYPSDAFSCDHTVLEVWIDDRWRLIDPSDARTGRHFRLYEHADEFHFGWQAWQRVRGGLDSKDRYCVVPGIPLGVDAWRFLHTALIRDLACLFGHEIQCGYYLPFKDMADDEAYPTLDRIAELMVLPDENRDELEHFFGMLKT